MSSITLLPLLLAQMPDFREPQPGFLAFYVALTIAFLFLGYLWTRLQNTGERLVLLGILVGAMAVGYGSVLPTAMVLAASLMKVSLVLVLGGVACCVMSVLSAGPAAYAERASAPQNPPPAEPLA